MVKEDRELSMTELVIEDLLLQRIIGELLKKYNPNHLRVFRLKDLRNRKERFPSSRQDLFC
jgi:hypothetical protein